MRLAHSPKSLPLWRLCNFPLLRDIECLWGLERFLAVIFCDYLLNSAIREIWQAITITPMEMSGLSSN